MNFPALANSFGATALKDLLLDQDILYNFEDSISSSLCSFPLDYSSQHQGYSTTVALTHCDNPREDISWGLQQYINGSNVPWTDKIPFALKAQNNSFGVTQTPVPQFPLVPNKEAHPISINSGENSVMSYHRGPVTAISYGLPASVDMDYGMVPGVRQAPSGEGRHHQRSSGSGYSHSKSGYDTGKSSRTSKSRANYDQDEGEEDEGADHPNYIPSSSSRAKARASSSSDFACWFFKLDPVKYADCMHVHGRSSDLKYAHLKHHFKNNAIPSVFDKNMSWDEVWATLFPRIPPPNNKYYVINDMIMSVLESSSVKGDDVTRFLDTLVNPGSRDAVINRIYSLSRDRGTSPGSVSSSTTRRNRQNLQLPSFERIPRTVDSGFTNTPPSSSSSSSNTTPATSRSHRYTSGFDSYAYGLDLAIEGTHLGADAYHPFTGAGGTLSPSSPTSSDVRKVLIHDEHTNILWFERDLPWPNLIDFNTFYLSHACTKTGHDQEIHIRSFDELQTEYAWHEPGQIGGNCHFTLLAVRRS